jgi:hypothetical protein
VPIFMPMFLPFRKKPAIWDQNSTCDLILMSLQIRPQSQVCLGLQHITFRG